ncbi:MAG: cystathionine gamma-synthase [Planctomycetota bacterium]|jgi:cystathionine beta-lyase|nr:cystathionine gamma-synthase [Planctomycetota bacterium]MSR38121.1 cystathionine gamma-synthase [Planctomycetota bacterium]
MKQETKQGFGTLAIHAGQHPDPSTGAIMTPVYMTSTYVQAAPALTKGYDYSRSHNPTRTAMEQNIAALEGGQFGLGFASGMAAIHCVLNLLQQGDHVVAGNDLYGGTYRILTTVHAKFGVASTFTDLSDLAAFERALKPNTKLVMLESPTNPLLRLYDLAAIAAICQRRGILTLADNTFASPYLQNPLKLGCDLVIHSSTKYLGGHSDVVGGVLVSNDAGLHRRLMHFQNSCGGTPGPMDCFLVLRGTKTLHIRMDRHCRNAMAVALFLASHPKVAKVHYPGLLSHPQHELAKRQMRDFGGMVSVELKATVEQAKQVASSFHVFSLAESLGGVESLVDHPASMTHASIPAAEREKAGLSDGLIRLSVGVEDEADLIADLAQALAQLN